MRQRLPTRNLSDLSGLRTGPYFRVSLADKEDKRKPTLEEERSTGTQRRIFREWAGRTRVIVADDYADPDMSASRFALKMNRPEFERMVADVRVGKLEILWFWEISRQQRRLEVFAELRNLCRDKGVLWVVRDRVLDPANSQDMLLAGIQSMMAEDESEKLSARVFDGKESSAMKGKRAGKIPYGYRRGPWDQDTETFGPDEPNVFSDGRPAEDSPAYIVRQIFERILAGWSITAIRRDLNERGIRTKPDKNHPDGSIWHNSQVRYIAMNPAYAGLRVRHIDHGGGLSRRASAVLELPEGVQVKWPALVDADTFWRVYRKLADPERKTTRLDRPGGRLLSAIARCGECGAKLTVHLGKASQGQRDDIYVCKERICAGIYVSDLDGYVEEVMKRWLADPEVAGQLTSIDDSPAARQARADADRARAELEALYRDARAGKVSAVIATLQEQGMKERIAEAEGREQAAVLPPVLRGRIGQQAADGWDDLDTAVRRQIIAAVADIRVHRVERHGNRQVPAADRVEWRWLLSGSSGRDAEQTRAAIRAHFDTQAAQLAARRAEVGRLRANGLLRPMIAEQLGISVTTVAKDLRACRSAT